MLFVWLRREPNYTENIFIRIRTSNSSDKINLDEKNNLDENGVL